jgi:hypothetical protein
MGIPNRQIGWGTEENLLWQIAGQISRINKIAANIQPPTQLVTTGLQANYDASDPLSFYTSVDYTPWRNIATLIGPFTAIANLNKIGSPTFSSNPNFLTFNGTNQGYSFSAYVVNGLAGVGSYGCWFKTTSTATGGSNFNDSPVIFTITGNDYDATLNFSNGRVGIGGADSDGNPTYLQYTTNTYNDGQWHYAVITYNTYGDNMKLYVDGVLQIDAVGTDITLGAVNFNFYLANFFSTSGTWWAGSIAVAQGYSIELTAEQVLQNYNALKDRYI